MPFRRINVTTSQSERQQQTANLVFLHRDRESQAILLKLRSLLPVDTEGNFLAFKPGATGAEEKSDVVQDFLGYLAEQMIDMYKEKQARAEAFWQDLETITDPGTFDTLRNKGKHQQSLATDPVCASYVDADSHSTRTLDESLSWDAACFEAFAAMLVGRAAVTPALTRIYEQHAPAYRALVTRIQETDDLIDQIVYRLYGLTEEEIAVVEGRA